MELEEKQESAANRPVKRKRDDNPFHGALLFGRHLTRQRGGRLRMDWRGLKQNNGKKGGDAREQSCAHVFLRSIGLKPEGPR